MSICIYILKFDSNSRAHARTHSFFPTYTQLTLTVVEHDSEVKSDSNQVPYHTRISFECNFLKKPQLSVSKRDSNMAELP